MLSLYHSEAILLPTLDSEIRNTPKLINEYFITFLKKEPQCTIQEAKEIKISESAVALAGHYSFKFKDNSSANARFTYLFSKKNDEWKISHHHSSLQP